MKLQDSRFQTQVTLSLHLVMKLGNSLSWGVLDAASMSVFKMLLGIRQGH